jgi:outer membrane murein-binding lipoprotein Lpp
VTYKPKRGGGSGGGGGGGTVTTPTTPSPPVPVDTTPDAFSFAAITGAALSEPFESQEITVSGITATTAVSVAGGTYSKNGSAYTADSGTVLSGDTLRLKVTSSASNNTAVSAILTIGGVSGTFTVTTRAAPSSPPSEEGLAGVHADTLTARAARVALFAGCWSGYGAQSFYSDQTATSVSDLSAKLAALDKTDLSRWHRIRLDSTATWSTAPTIRGSRAAYSPDVVLGHLYGGELDRSTLGGGVLITSTDTADPAFLSGGAPYYGYRGIEFNAIGMGKAATAATGTARDGAQACYVQRTSTFPEAPVVRFVDCNLGALWNPAVTNPLLAGVVLKQNGYCEQLDVIDSTFKGGETLLAANGCRFIRIWGNDFTRQIGDTRIILGKSKSSQINSNFSDRTLVWSRLNTGRYLVDDADIADKHADAQQSGTSSDVQSYTILVEHDVFQMERPNSYADVRRVSIPSNPTNGQTLTVSGTVFTFRTTASASTDIQIGATRAETIANVEPKLEAAGISNLMFVLPSSGSFDIYFTAGNIGSVSSSAGWTVTTVRPSGGVQGLYNDDSAATISIDLVAICCIFATYGTAVQLYQGTSIIDRCTFARTARIAPNAEAGTDGYDYSTDDDAYVRINRAAGNPAIHVTIRNSVLSGVSGIFGTITEDGTYNITNGTLILENNRYVGWAADHPSETRADTLLNGPFSTDAQGRITYSVTNDASNSQAAFRAEMYARLKLADEGDRADIGSTDPAFWV